MKHVSEVCVQVQIIFVLLIFKSLGIVTVWMGKLLPIIFQSRHSFLKSDSATDSISISAIIRSDHGIRYNMKHLSHNLPHGREIMMMRC